MSYDLALLPQPVLAPAHPVRPGFVSMDASTVLASAEGNVLQRLEELSRAYEQNQVQVNALIQSETYQASMEAYGQLIKLPYFPGKNEVLCQARDHCNVQIANQIGVQDKAAYLQVLRQFDFVDGDLKSQFVKSMIDLTSELPDAFRASKSRHRKKRVHRADAELVFSPSSSWVELSMWYTIAWARLPEQMAADELAQSRRVINKKLIRDVEFCNQAEYEEALQMHIGAITYQSMLAFHHSYKNMAGKSARF